ncbi:hypothetical protein LCGC14_2633860 [marine sediment metagenome]|uniref:Uncharacterized protein n=1 Tax=marine sediment metagenome TaxID=412755 RepID=A0A0F8ZZK5_9ZZZZ
MAKKQKTIRQLVKIADRWFSQYIRLKYAFGNGMCICVTCGKPYHWKKIHAGHYIVRVWMRTRYDGCNVHPQCCYCNTWLNGNTEMYHDYIIDTYGQEEIDALKRISRISPNSADRDELEKLIETLKLVVAKLRKDKGL